MRSRSAGAIATQRESRAQAARQTEQLRTAVLDALAHQFKTPLTVARTASSGLLAVKGLSELQRELVATIDRYSYAPPTWRRRG
jgi:two-component system, OmpR family, sensor histidine kinase KdpD